jgi:hypothetical protein
MKPLRTALTTTAFRRATQRLVSGGGKSTIVVLVHGKISTPDNSYSLTLSSIVQQ